MEEFDIGQVEFRNLTLERWEELLTVTMPSLPAPALEINRTLANLNNKYQDAYNCYIELLVMHKNLGGHVKVLIETEVTKIIADLKKESKTAKIPGKETLVMMASKKESVATQEEELMKIEIVKDFFEHHKDKLGKMMLLANSLSYGSNQSDRYQDKHGERGQHG